MSFVLELQLFEDDEQRLSLDGQQVRCLQTSDERTLISDVPLAFSEMPPDHVEFGLFRAH